LFFLNILNNKAPNKAPYMELFNGEDVIGQDPLSQPIKYQ